MPVSSFSPSLRPAGMSCGVSSSPSRSRIDATSCGIPLQRQTIRLRPPASVSCPVFSSTGSGVSVSGASPLAAGRPRGARLQAIRR